MPTDIRGLTVYRPAWRDETTGAVRLEEARVMGREGGVYRLAFRGKTDGRWREKRGWWYTDVYASPAHYEAYDKRARLPIASATWSKRRQTLWYDGASKPAGHHSHPLTRQDSVSSRLVRASRGWKPSATGLVRR